jgi:hypothetical protein
MAWIEKKQRRDGTVSARVVWRLGGTREGAYQSETFGAGSDAQNLARADGFKKMVAAAGQRWPDGWVRGEGFVWPRGEADPLKAPPPFVDIGEEYVRQIVDLSPGQRKRYLGHLKVLAETQVQGSLVFTKPVTAVTEADLKDWLICWERSLKTKANCHGLIHGVFAFAVKRVPRVQPGGGQCAQAVSGQTVSPGAVLPHGARAGDRGPARGSTQ